MLKAVIAVGVLVAMLVLAAVLWAPGEQAGPTVEASPAVTPSTGAAHPGHIYGRITTHDGVAYEGRLRWGGDQEAFWGDYFNGYRDENAWADQVPPERLTRGSHTIELFGFEIAYRKRKLNLDRPFMARFGDIAYIEAVGADVQVTLKSGSRFILDRLSANDHDDGVRVWDGSRGVVDLESSQVRTVKFLPAAGEEADPYRLHGTVQTIQGHFTGFIQWDRLACCGSDRLQGNRADGEVDLSFDTIGSIERRSVDSALVTMKDDRELLLSEILNFESGHRGIHVDDRRYGRVLVSWAAFERVEFNPGGGGPAYGDFPPGRPLTGSVTTRTGRCLAGRLVYDLDESETTETLDAPSRGVTYTIPFGLVASIVPAVGQGRGGRHCRVTLNDGEELDLERAGDLGGGNAGMLIFVEGDKPPEYVPWADVERVSFDRPPAMYPPLEAGGIGDPRKMEKR